MPSRRRAAAQIAGLLLWAAAISLVVLLEVYPRLVGDWTATAVQLGSYIVIAAPVLLLRPRVPLPLGLSRRIAVVATVLLVAAVAYQVVLGASVDTGLRHAVRAVSAGVGEELVFRGAYSMQWWGEEATPHVVLQRKVGSGAWTTTTATVSLTRQGLSVRTPAFSTKARTRTVAYRLRSLAYSTGTTGVRTTSTSKTVRVVYENQRRYTGLARTVYRTVEAYCPATAVHVGPLSEKAGDYRTGALLIRIAGSVRGYRPIDVRAVALHECSHERQWLSYGGTSAGWAQMEAAAATSFADWTVPAGATYPYVAPAASITPVEHAADCGAQAVNRGGYLGYGGYCTASELKAAKRLLTGHRY